jgi:N-acetylneuraminate synthase
MKAFCDDLNIDCTSTPFSETEADFLIESLDTPFIKVASMDLNNYPFLAYLAKKNRPMIISTGLSELYEIDKAVKAIEREGNFDITILHCVATYPPEDADVNLNNIAALKSVYPDYKIGFSDHTLGTAIPTAAFAFGISVLEKHFTLDKNMEGWDHKISATPEEMKEICDNAVRITKALGTYRISAPESNEKKQEFRRSIVLTKAFKSGEILQEGDITYKRPGVGIPPELSEFIVGRTIKHDLPYDHILTLEDIV